VAEPALRALALSFRFADLPAGKAGLRRRIDVALVKLPHPFVRKAASAARVAMLGR
jgi:hypothetical protein